MDDDDRLTALGLTLRGNIITVDGTEYYSASFRVPGPCIKPYPLLCIFPLLRIHYFKYRSRFHSLSMTLSLQYLTRRRTFKNFSQRILPYITVMRDL